MMWSIYWRTLGFCLEKWKNLHSWKCFVQILRFLHRLKEEGLRKGFGISNESKPQKCPK
ncbi:BnaCnng21100D [Brassica napus]|uniref:BnaCnng21100D protein n=1 Tax=Brassica napus TaxID=3708 RepID=A0A078IR96_BRANA|nr:BnaCnng21100D [Brassica napus]